MIGKAVFILFSSATLICADPVTDKLTSAGIAEFTSAYQKWDAARFEKSADWFRQAADRDPSSATNHYWRGAALFHRMLQLRNPPNGTPDNKAADAAMDAAVASLETAIKLDSTDAESHALLGTLYGMKINGSMIRAIRFGPGVQDHQKEALKHGAANPRVRYLLGTGQFHTAENNDSRREALNTLLAAEKLFASEARKPAKPFEPRWGYSSCLTFIARSCESLGMKPEAIRYFKKALAEHPADHVAKEGIKRLTGS